MLVSRASLPGTWLSQVQIILLTMLVLTTWILILYSETLSAMIKVWTNSETFAHGALILPISAYLIFQKRNELQKHNVRPSVIGFLLLLASLLLWLVSSLASVQVGAQLGLVAVIGSSFWAVLGTDIARSIRFALFYAVFAVPFGELLIPPLMMWTANFVVLALNITGVPVYLEGLYFSLPGGNFQVIAACSGIRYLIVTVVLGLLFAYARFSSWRKRVIFIGFAAAIMLIANGLRAYLIVLIAHLTDMKHGAGVDHVFIGWLVFFLAVVLTFWVGSKYADRNGPVPSSIAGRTGSLFDSQTIQFGFVVFWSAIVFATIAMGPLLLQRANSAVPGNWPRTYLPEAAEGWDGPTPATLAYSPVAPGSDYYLAGSYLGSDDRVEIHEVFFSEQSQGDELVGQESKIFDDNLWRPVQWYGTDTFVTPAERRITVKRVLLTDGRKQILLWFWYDIGGWSTTSEALAKLYHAVHSLTRRHAGDALYVFVTPVSDEATARASLQLHRFLRDHLGPIRSCLRVVSELPPGCADSGQSK